MKLAILISGEYRKFDVSRKTMLFLDNPNVDIYVCTWDKTIYSSKKIDFYKEYDVNEEIILRDLGRYANIKIDKHDSIKETKYNCKMINRWLNGFEMIKNSGIEYDYILIMRTDLYFQFISIPNFESLEKYDNGIGVAWATSLHLGKLGDILFISSYENIAKLFNKLTIDSWSTDTEDDWHIWWYKFVYNLFPNIINSSEFDHLTFCRYWATNENTFNEIVKIYHDWRDLRLLHEIDLMGTEWLNNGNVWSIDVVDNAKAKWIEGYFEKYK